MGHARSDDDTSVKNGLPSPAVTPAPEEASSRLHQQAHEEELDVDTAIDISSRISLDPRQNMTADDGSSLGTRSRANSLPTRALSPRLPTLKTFDGATDVSNHGILKLSPAKINELASAPGSLPFRPVSPVPEESPSSSQVDLSESKKWLDLPKRDLKVAAENLAHHGDKTNGRREGTGDMLRRAVARVEGLGLNTHSTGNDTGVKEQRASRPTTFARSVSVPYPAPTRASMPGRVRPKRLHSKITTAPEDDKKSELAMSFAVAQSGSQSRSSSHERTAPTKGQPVQLPPLSIPTQLHLELSADRAPASYNSRSDSTHAPYESSKVKFDRLLNFLLLPPQLEQVLLFGALTCFDAWLYTFTILPLRFLKALRLLLEWLVNCVVDELGEVAGFIYRGVGRLWHRHRWRRSSPSSAAATQSGKSQFLANGKPVVDGTLPPKGSTTKNQSLRTRVRASFARSRPRLHTKPSSLQANHKADLLEGLLIIISCIFLMHFDASRMYHAIRGQAAIKLYVIYNALEVFDRLFSALGQDIMECLFSAETLDRKPNGRSRIVRPFWMFLLALVYTVLHATAFFYQVITLNVAVNSYSNALLTLLMSNQFVEIKGTVFKKIEKENLFQLTCADVVERFQLWLMLLIIMLRNMVELGGLSVSSGDYSGPSSSGPQTSNSSTGVPFRTFGILPKSFTILPSLFPAQVLGPFLLVLGSEMLVDWLKHAYITKFNAMSHRVYGRFLDVLAKDYYSSAFAEQGLTRRLGLPVIPLTCLFIRATLQTYHMFLATNVSTPTSIISSTTSLSTDTEATAFSPIIAQIDHIFRSALGRSAFGSGAASSASSWFGIWMNWTLDDAIALTTMLVVFLAVYLILLVLKLSLGMALLRFSKERYKGMKKRERQSYVQTETKRLGGYGAVQLGDERRKVIYEGDPAGLKAMRDREAKMKEGGEWKGKLGGGGGDKLDEVDRYSMVAKRIW